MTEVEVIVLGGGCFWCTEAVFREVRGVVAAEVGYCNGITDFPTYEQVCGGNTGYCEVVRLEYVPTQVPLEELLEVFFLIHDPTTLNRQGADIGTQYRSGVYWTQDYQARLVRQWLERAQRELQWAQPVVTEVLPLMRYHRAEEYHQQFYAHNPGHGYCQLVAQPKLAKFRSTLQRLCKS